MKPIKKYPAIGRRCCIKSNKICYDDKLNALRKQFDLKLKYVYLCDYCNSYHLTSQTKMEHLFKRSKLSKIMSFNAYKWLEHWISERHPKGSYPLPVKYYFYKNNNSREYFSKFIENVIIKVLRYEGCDPIKAPDKGRSIDMSKTVKDVTGMVRIIGSRVFVKDERVQVGRADVKCYHRGQMVNFEVKVGSDRQSEAQKAEQQRAESNGEVYLIIKTIDDFIKYLEG